MNLVVALAVLTVGAVGVLALLNDHISLANTALITILVMIFLALQYGDEG
jgi:hypothetical protein